MPKAVQKGVTDLASQRPNVAEDWDYSKNIKKPKDFSQYSNKKAWWLCSKNHSWEAIIANRSKGAGCPECAKDTRGKNISKTKTAGNKPLKENTRLMKEFSIINSYNPYIKGNSYSVEIIWICSICSKSWVAKLSKRIKGGGCPNCSNNNRGKVYKQSIIQSQGSLFEKFPEIEELWDYDLNGKHNINPKGFSAGSHSYAYWLCSKCKNSWRAVIKSVSIRGSRCPKCVRRKSKGEDELFAFIQEMFKDAVRNDRGVIKPKELDIYIPSKRVAIEYNGEYWHSNEVIAHRENSNSEDYHKKKLSLCKVAGVDLLFIWEDDWRTQKELVKSAFKDFIFHKTKNEFFNRLTSNRDS